MTLTDLISEYNDGLPKWAQISKRTAPHSECFLDWVKESYPEFNIERMTKMYEAIAATPNPKGEEFPPVYARIEVRGRTEWRSKKTAIKHAREYKARHLRDAWAQEI